MAAPLAAMAATFTVVTAYRQLTEERAKRQIRGLFAHALSPALVDRLIEDPSLAAHLRPTPSLDAGPSALALGASAGMDLSDGLATDLPPQTLALPPRQRE